MNITDLPCCKCSQRQLNRSVGWSYVFKCQNCEWNHAFYYGVAYNLMAKYNHALVNLIRVEYFFSQGWMALISIELSESWVGIEEIELITLVR